MANPRQRRKTKSSSYKAVSHSKRAKRLQRKMPAIRGPKPVQDAWDPSKTIRQNYVALGLQYDLNPIASGGSEVHLINTTDQINAGQMHRNASSSSTDIVQSTVSERPIVTSGLPKGFGRIIRDPSGNVVGVELPDEDSAENFWKEESGVDAPLMMNELELSVWADDRPGAGHGGDPGGAQIAIVQELENLADSATTHQRYTSSGERLYLERLVKKYDDDLENMARDRRLNPEQRTANELKRAIAKAGGIGALCQSTVVAIAE